MALRRVATLVARGIDPAEIFLAVAEEIRRLLGADSAGIGRYEPDGTSVVVVGAVGEGQVKWPIGMRMELVDYLPPAVVWRTGRSARVDEDLWRGVADPDADRLRERGIRSMVASPIIVDGRLWGVVNALTRRGPFPPGTADRMADFTELVATAGNAQSRAELAELEAEIDRVAGELNGVVEDLREIARGIHPAILSEGGLGPALRTLARRAAIAVELDVAAMGRLPEPIEVAAYYVCSEALTNATRHAQASVVRVAVKERDDRLHLSICNDGVGGVDPARGSGLIGLRDRMEALGGSIEVSGPPGEGTLILVQLPLRLH